MRKTLLERFWSKVEVHGSDECWEWTAYKDPYGQIWAWGKQRKTHRISWGLHYGAIPDGMCICHHCDNPGCVNPAHLFLGTKADNNADMCAKGRQVVGEKQHLAKLTQEQVLEIRRLYAQGMSQGELGKCYGVHQVNVGFIVRRETWKHI